MSCEPEDGQVFGADDRAVDVLAGLATSVAGAWAAIQFVEISRDEYERKSQNRAVALAGFVLGNMASWFVYVQNFYARHNRCMEGKLRFDPLLLAVSFMMSVSSSACGTLLASDDAQFQHHQHPSDSILDRLCKEQTWKIRARPSVSVLLGEPAKLVASGSIFAFGTIVMEYTVSAAIVPNGFRLVYDIPHLAVACICLIVGLYFGVWFVIRILHWLPSRQSLRFIAALGFGSVVFLFIQASERSISIVSDASVRAPQNNSTVSMKAVLDTALVLCPTTVLLTQIAIIGSFRRNSQVEASALLKEVSISVEKEFLSFDVLEVAKMNLKKTLQATVNTARASTQ